MAGDVQNPRPLGGDHIGDAGMHAGERARHLQQRHQLTRLQRRAGKGLPQTGLPRR